MANELFPAPPMVSLTPQGEPVQMPTGGIPQQAAADPFGDAASPEARAQHFMTSDPNYVDARSTMNDWKAHQAKRKELESSIESLASKYGVNPNDPAASLGGLAEHAAGNFGAHGGLITRMLTLHERQVASRQDAQRKQAATGIAALKFMKDAYDKGDENMLAASGRYIGLGSDAKDLMKEYASQDHKDEVNQRLQKQLDEKVREDSSKDTHRNFMEGIAQGKFDLQKLAAPLQRQLMQEMATGHVSDNVIKAVTAQYAAPMAVATLADKQQAPKLKVYNAISGRIGASGQQPALAPPPPPGEMMPSLGAPGPVMQMPNGQVVPAQDTPKFSQQKQVQAAQIANTQAATAQKQAQTEKLTTAQLKSYNQRLEAIPEMKTVEYWKAHPEQWKGITERQPLFAEHIRATIAESRRAK